MELRTTLEIYFAINLFAAGCMLGTETGEQPVRVLARDVVVTALFFLPLLIIFSLSFLYWSMTFKYPVTEEEEWAATQANQERIDEEHRNIFGKQ